MCPFVVVVVVVDGEKSLGFFMYLFMNDFLPGCLFAAVVI